MIIITELKKEVGHLNAELNGMAKSVRILNSGINSIDTILIMGKLAKSMKGIGYIVGSSNPNTMFVLLLKMKKPRWLV